MKITITNFRSHMHSEYVFQDGALTLLSGRSGCGKTTVFQALFWCLYSGVRDVYPNTSKNSAPKVIVEIGPYTIIRSKKPESLTVSWSSGHYEGVEAQSIVDQLFGNKDLWLTTSYLQQRDRCKLLSGSNADRLEILNKLSFCSSDPEEVLEHVQEKLVELSTSLQDKSNKFSSNLELFTKQLEERQPKMEYKDLDIATIIDQLPQAEEKLKQLEKQLVEHQSNIAVKNNLEKQLASVQEQLGTSNSQLLQEEIKGKQQELDQLHKYTSTRNQLLEQEKQRTSLCQQRDQVQSLIPKEYQKQGREQVTQEQVWNTQKQEQAYQYNKSLAQSLGIEYSMQVIQARLEQLNNKRVELGNMDTNLKMLNNYRYITKQHQDIIGNIGRQKTTIEQLEEQLEQILSKITQLPNNQEEHQRQLEQHRSKVFTLEQASNCLQCPHCQQSVRLVQNKLAPIDQPAENISNISQAIQEHKQVMFKIQAQIQTETSIQQGLLQSKTQLETRIPIERRNLDQLVQAEEQLSKQVASYPPMDNINTQQMQIQTQQEIQDNLQRITRELQALANIQVVNQPPIPSVILDKLFRLNQYNAAIAKIPEFDSSFALDKTQAIQSINQELSQCQSKYYQTLELERQYQSIQKQLSVIITHPGIEQQVEEYRNIITINKQAIVEAQYASKMFQWHAALQQQELEIEAISQDVEAIEHIRKTAIQVECELLEATVSAINTTMALVLEKMFDDPITTKLSLFRTLKTKSKSGEKTKPQVNLGISYRGGEYDNISQLSGGEGDRISLALAISLNAISPSPVILLDESLSSLDGAYRESCLKALRILSQRGKTVICINHEDTEGHYDDTITDFPN